MKHLTPDPDGAKKAIEFPGVPAYSEVSIELGNDLLRGLFKHVYMAAQLKPVFQDVGKNIKIKIVQ